MKRSWEVLMSRSGRGTHGFYSFSCAKLGTHYSHCCLHVFCNGTYRFFPLWAQLYFHESYIWTWLLVFCFVLNQGIQIGTWKNTWALGFTFFCCSWKRLLCEVPDNLLDAERQMAQNSPMLWLTVKQPLEVDPKVNEWVKQNLKQQQQ